MKGRIIKWEGDPPTEADAYVNPETHPKCVEVIEVAEGEAPRVVFKKEDVNNGTD
jgi:hypothetical protein